MILNKQANLHGRSSVLDAEAMCTSITYDENTIISVCIASHRLKKYLMSCANREDSNQTERLRSLIRVIPVCIYNLKCFDL